MSSGVELLGHVVNSVFKFLRNQILYFSVVFMKPLQGNSV